MRHRIYFEPICPDRVIGVCNGRRYLIRPRRGGGAFYLIRDFPGRALEEQFFEVLLLCGSEGYGEDVALRLIRRILGSRKSFRAWLRHSLNR